MVALFHDDARDFDVAELVLDTVGILHGDAPVELRVIPVDRAGGVRSGVFTDHVALAETAARLDAASEAVGLYVNLNTLAPHVSVANELSAAGAVKDADVAAYRWLLIDLDRAPALRDAHDNATDDEVRALIARAAGVCVRLEALGAPPGALAVAQSGNGAHVLARIALPATPASRTLVNDSLGALGALFTDDVADVDQRVGNPARITRCYGTLARKAPATDDRPQRRSWLLRLPELDVVVPSDVLERLAALAPTHEAPPRVAPRCGQGRRPHDTGTSYTEIAVEHWLRERFDIARVMRDASGTVRFQLRRCPWRDHHVEGGAFVLLRADGAVASGCLKAKCAGESWRTLTALVGDRPARTGG